MKLKVYFANKLAGSLFSTPDKGIVFAYEDSYVRQNGNPLSISLPVRSDELPEDIEPNQNLTYRLDADNYEELSEDVLLGYIKNAETRPLLKANEELRLSLAGAQEKLPLACKIFWLKCA